MTAISDNTISPSVLAAMNPASSTTAKSTAAAAQDRFMTLLVTQMKNQDPLNPLDNAQVTSQLAQLSTVTGVDKLNTTLESLMGSYQSSQQLQAAGMIGHSVLTPGSGVSLSAGHGLFGLDMKSPADDIKITINDSSGHKIREVDLGSQQAGVVPLQWDGKNDAGDTVPDGQYSYKVDATIGGKSTTDFTALTVGQVSSVSTSATGVTLNVPNVGSVSLADIRQIF